MNSLNTLTNELNMVYNLISNKFVDILTKKLNNDFAFIEDYEVTCYGIGVINLDRIYVGQLKDGNLIPCFCSKDEVYSMDSFIPQEILNLLEYLSEVKSFL